MGDGQQVADRTAYGHDDGQAHGKTHLEGFRGEAALNLAEQVEALFPACRMRRVFPGRAGLENQHRHVQKAAAENAHASFRYVHVI